jgi:hypothetical protein
MSTWGFEAKNNAGQVLVSSETRNLHFVGKAGLNRVIRQFDGYGGLRHYAFWIDCEVTPVPFFTMPTYDFYGIVAVRQISLYANRKTWEIELIRSGTSATVPEVYVFSDPRGTTARNTNYGMLVLRDDGTPSFDSRLNPLTVNGGVNVAPPANPLTVAPTSLSAKNCNSDPASQMGPNNYNTYRFTPGGELTPAYKPIFYYPSIAQAEREFAFYASEEECDGLDAYNNCVGAKRVYSWYSYYWAFYRGGIQYTGGYLKTGWIAAQFGCHWTYNKDSSFVGIGIGGSSGDSGQWPYTNETLNLTPTAVITANGARYD